jgi:hypothetical protein
MNNNDNNQPKKSSIKRKLIDSRFENKNKYLIVKIYREILFLDDKNNNCRLNKFQLKDGQCNLIDILAYNESYDKFPRNLQLYDVKKKTFFIFKLIIFIIIYLYILICKVN